ncbi:MAG: ATP-binding cassette domain-containing protein [Acidobacteriota bacterium]
MIKAEHLSMWYGNFRALHDASFELQQGEVLGLLGPNGAGKSTTLKILTTFITPTEGRVLVDGVDVADDPIAARQKIGYLPETAPLYLDMMVSEYLAFVGSARGIASGDIAKRRAAVVERCGLEAVYHRPIGHLSKGYKQRVGLAQALIHDPEIVILDEPTSGLDPLQILGIRDLVRELARDRTVMFSTHILQEIEAVSDRVMIINEGRIIAEGGRDELEKRAMGDDRMAVEVVGPADEVATALRGVSGVAGVEEREPSEDGLTSFSIRHAFGDGDLRDRIDDVLRDKGWRIRQLGPDRFSLEEVFISLVRQGGNPADESGSDEESAAVATAGGEA